MIGLVENEHLPWLRDNFERLGWLERWRAIEARFPDAMVGCARLRRPHDFANQRLWGFSALQLPYYGARLIYRMVTPPGCKDVRQVRAANGVFPVKGMGLVMNGARALAWALPHHWLRCEAHTSQSKVCAGAGMQTLTPLIPESVRAYWGEEVADAG